MPSKHHLALVIMFLGTSVSTAQTRQFDGVEAGDRKELIPGIAFHWCPAGSFIMGEADNVAEVILTKGFWLSETEITQGQWHKLTGTKPREFRQCLLKQQRHGRLSFCVNISGLGDADAECCYWQ